MSLTRRDFLKRSGVGAGGGVLGGLASLGLDPQAVQTASLPLDFRIAETRAVPSVCPFCAVGCGLIVHVRDNQILNIEGNPDSPINRGTLCPKGAATFQLSVNPHRRTACLYRRPGGTEWEAIDLQQAMDLVAQRVKATRDATFRRTANVEGREVTVNHTLAIGSLGGATIDNEWNYVQAKFMRGIGGVFLENQARI